MAEERDFRSECYSCKHRRSIPGDAHIACVNPDMSIKANKHGIRNGWFIYPFNFDPVWKETLCNNFEAGDSSGSVASEELALMALMARRHMQVK